MPDKMDAIERERQWKKRGDLASLSDRNEDNG